MIAAVMNIMWGLNLIAVKVSVDLLGALPAALLRQATVFAVCLPFLKVMPGRMRWLVTLGVLSGALFYIAINFSLAVSDNVSALAIAGQLGVPFSLILAIFVLGERIHLPRVLGIVLSFAGVVLLVFDPAAGREVPGLLLTALASLIWAASSLIQRKLIGVPVLTIYAWVGLLGTVILFPVAMLIAPGEMAALPHVPLESFGWVAFSAIGSTVVGQGAMSYLLQRHPVSTVIPLTLAAPVISVLVASWYFGTPLTTLMVMGGLIAMTGVAIVTFRTAGAGESAR